MKSKINFIKRLLLVLMVLITCIPQTWGAITFSGGKIYFADIYDIHSNYVYLCARKSNYTWPSLMTNIGHTKLYYRNYPDGSTDGNILGWVVISNSATVQANNFDNWTDFSWCSNWNTYGFNNNNTYLIVPSSASKSQSVTTTYHSSGPTAFNNSQTVKKYTRVDGAGSYSAASVASGTVTISAYKMTGDGTASNSSNSSTISAAGITSASRDAAYTGEVTVTASANTGYVFMGWYGSENGDDKLYSNASYTYNAPNSTKTVYARFAEKLTVGKTLYLATNSSWRGSSANFEAVFCNATTQKWVSCSPVTGTSDMYSVTVPSGDWGCVIFCRMNPSGTAHSWSGKWCQTDDMYKSGTYNCVKITGDCSNSQNWCRYSKDPVIIRSHNDWDPENADVMSISGNTCTKSLEFNAKSTYQVKILDGTTEYGLNEHVVTSSISNYTIKSGEYQLRVATAGAGDYSFTYDKSNHQLSIAYPTVSHPSTDYCYVIDYSWGTPKLHIWGSSSGAAATSSVTTGPTLYNKVEIQGTNYFYIAPGDYANFLVSNNGDASNRTGDLNSSDGYGKYRWADVSTWKWSNWSFTVTLTEQVTTTSAPSDPSVEFNGTALTSIASKPACDYYTFGGYYTAAGGGGSQLIDADKAWKASVSGYTDGSKKWIHEGGTAELFAKWTQSITLNQNGATTSGSTSLSATYNAVLDAFEITNPSKDYYTFAGWTNGSGGTGSVVIDENKDVKTVASWTDGSDKWIHNAASELYAKWDEDKHMVTLANDGFGHVEISSSTVTSVSGIGVATASSTITAVPTPGYQFVNWTGDFGDGVIIATGSTDDASITINATADGKTIRANFEPITYTNNTINSNGGDSDGKYSVTFDDNKIVIVTVPEKAGYEVTGYTLFANTANPIADVDGNIADGENTYIKDNKWRYAGGVEIFAQWAPKPYTITLNQQGGSDGSSYFTVTMNNNNYKYGVDEDDEITKPTKTGYTFGGYYTAVDGGGTQIFEINGDDECVLKTGVSGYTAANGNWINTDDDLVLYAKWTANTYTITLDDREATGSGTDEVTATYDSDDLSSAISNPTKWGNTFAGWVANSNGTGNVIINTSGELVGGISGYTDGEGNWTRDNGNLTLYAKWTPKAASSIYLIDHSASPTAVSSLTTFNETGTAGVYYVTVDMNTNDVYHFGDGVAAAGPAGASADRTFLTPLDVKDLDINSYGFKYTGTKKQTVVFRIDLNSYDDKVRLYVDHLVIYRNGDKGGDGHVAYGSVAGFNGTIYGEFEYRMSVHEDTWSSLYLPFSPSAVKVWDAEDGAYYPVLPYYRTKADGPLYDGHYVIRKPSKNTNLELENFGKWTDPEDDDELPVGNQPYIIQWHDFTGGHYFEGRYISFYGDDGVSIPSSMPEGTVPETGGVVNICGNTALIAGEAEGAYVLNSDYGEGAWLRGEKVTDKSPVGPFECFILADAETTSSHLVIKRRTGDDTTTGWDDVLNTEPQTQVIVYSITGIKVAQYENCSLTEAGLLLNAIYNEGVFILRAGNESVKLIIGK